MPTTPGKKNPVAAKPAPTIDHATAILVIKSKSATKPAPRVTATTPVPAKPGKDRLRRSPAKTEP